MPKKNRQKPMNTYNTMVSPAKLFLKSLNTKEMSNRNIPITTTGNTNMANNCCLSFLISADDKGKISFMGIESYLYKMISIPRIDEGCPKIRVGLIAVHPCNEITFHFGQGRRRGHIFVEHSVIKFHAQEHSSRIADAP